MIYRCYEPSAGLETGFLFLFAMKVKCVTALGLFAFQTTKRDHHIVDGQDDGLNSTADYRSTTLVARQ